MPENPLGIWGWIRIGATLILLIYGPQLGMSIATDRLPPHEFTGIWLRLLWAIPFALAWAALLGPLAWALAYRHHPALSLIFASFGVPILAWQTAGTVNVALDHSPGVRVEVTFLHRVSPHKGPAYEEFIDGREPPGTLTLIRSNFREGDRIAGAKGHLLVHPGALGLEWVEPPNPGQ